MVNTVSAWEARRNFGKLMDDVARRGQPVVIESHGEPKVAVVPVHLLEAWEHRRRRAFDLMRESAERANLSDEEAMEVVNAAIERVRRDARG
jgi:prevent-host-death family protein